MRSVAWRRRDRGGIKQCEALLGVAETGGGKIKQCEALLGVAETGEIKQCEALLGVAETWHRESGLCVDRIKKLTAIDTSSVSLRLPPSPTGEGWQNAKFFGIKMCTMYTS